MEITPREQRPHAQRHRFVPGLGEPEAQRHRGPAVRHEQFDLDDWAKRRTQPPGGPRLAAEMLDDRVALRHVAARVGLGPELDPAVRGLEPGHEALDEQPPILRWLQGAQEQPVVAARPDAGARAAGEAAQAVRFEPLVGGEIWLLPVHGVPEPSLERRGVCSRCVLGPSWWGRHAPPPSAEVNSAEPPPTRRRLKLLTRETSLPQQTVCRSAMARTGNWQPFR